MSIQAQYVKKVKKLPESRAINPQMSQTMKDLQLKIVNCVSSKITLFSQGTMMVLKMCRSQNISFIAVCWSANSTR